MWRDTLGSRTNLVADGNGNGVIDKNDFELWKGYFAAAAGSGSAAIGGAVPEPTSLTLLALSATVLFGYRQARS